MKPLAPPSHSATLILFHSSDSLVPTSLTWPPSSFRIPRTPYPSSLTPLAMFGLMEKGGVGWEGMELLKVPLFEYKINGWNGMESFHPI